MSQFIPLVVGVVALFVGSILGYYARQSIAKKQAGTLEAKLEKRVSKVKQDSETIISEAKAKAEEVLEKTKKEIDSRRYELFRTERLLLKRENILDQKLSDFERNQKEFQEKIEKVRAIKESLEKLRQEALDSLERIAILHQKEAKR